MLTMAKLGYVVLRLTQAIGDAEDGGNRRQAEALWERLGQAIERARTVEKPASGTPEAITNWWEGKIYLFTLALQPRAARYATEEWLRMVEHERARAQTDYAEWQAKRDEARNFKRW